jgi:peptidyl-prolyl cis-trans isomerase SDCCAG10
MTCDACPWLDKKHTIFGRIEGPTLYNLVKINELETGPEDRPVSEPMPKIVRTEVITNPFEDIVPRNLTRKDKFEEEDTFKAPHPPTKKPGTGGPKDTNLLSFVEDEEEDASTSKVNRFAARKKIQSSHDVLAHQDPTLSTESVVNAKLL